MTTWVAVINECLFPQLHDCSQNALCKDTLEGYECECRANFRDKSPDRSRPGRICQPRTIRHHNLPPSPSNPNNSPGINECKFDHLNDCHRRATCTDLDEGFTCACNAGFRDTSPRSKPGRICQRVVNECSDPSLNSCDPNADCFDEAQGYRCKCRENYLDISPTVGAPGSYYPAHSFLPA